jgi:hypothetical protein
VKKQPNDKQIAALSALVDLLDKVGIKSATYWQQLEIFSEMSKRVQANFGRPDQLFMSPQTLSAYKKAFTSPKVHRKVKP